MKTVCVTSGKGGVGKSNVAANLGLALAERGARVLLVDADLGLANADILLGLDCRGTLLDVIEGRRKVSEILSVVSDRLRLLPASSGILKLDRLSPTQRTRLASELQHLADDFDVLLIDTASGLAETVLFFASTADDVLLVTTPEPPAITDAYAMAKLLTGPYQVRSLNLLVNLADSPEQAKATYEKITSVSERFLGRRLRYFGMVPRDQALVDSVLDQRPVLTNRPDSPSAHAFRELAGQFEQALRGNGSSKTAQAWEALAGRGH